MSFSISLGKAVAKRKDEAEKKIKGTLFSISSSIIIGTPVGNPSLWMSKPPKGYVGGSLRGGWNASIGRIDISQSGKIDASGGDTIGSMSVSIENLELGDTFYLTNPLPYAWRVEYGWSSQRPKGMVRQAIMQANQYLRAQK